MKPRSQTSRKVVNALAMSGSALAALAGIAVLLWVLAVVVLRGADALDLDFFTQLPLPPGMEGGGLANAILGSLIVNLLAAAMAVPLGVMAGVYSSEFAAGGAFGSWVRFSVNMLMGIPSIIVGLFIWGLVVVTTGSFSAWAGALSLAIIMMPIVARTTEDMLRLVPDTLRESAIAMGAPRWKAMGVLVLTAKKGLLTGVLLALARVSGETAPLLFTALNSPYMPSGLSAPTANLPVTIFNYAMSPYSNWQEMAWGASLVITLGVLLLSVGARTIFREKTR